MYGLAEIIASNYLNGNISDARKALLSVRRSKDASATARAAALAIMVGDLLDDAEERGRWNLAVLRWAGVP